MPAARRLGIVAVVLVFVALSARTAGAVSLSYDEVYTLHLSRFASPGELWGWLAAGTDLNPPLNYLATRAGTAVLGDHPTAVRAAPVAAFAGVLLLVYAHLRRRSELAGWLGVLFLLACNLSTYYAVFARAYALMLFCGAAVLVLRSRAYSATPVARRAAAAGLAAALTAGMYAHYFGVLLFLPVAAGELAHWWSERRVNRAVVAAGLVAAASAVPLLPLIQVGRSFAAGFWAKPDASLLEVCYGLIVLNMATPLAVVAGACAWATRAADPGDRGSVRAHDLAAELGFLAIPAAAVAVGVLVTHAFDKRYAIAGYLGAACVFARLAEAFLRRNRWAAAVALLALAGWWLLGTELRYRKAVADDRPFLRTSEVVGRQLADGRTVVVGYSQLFLRLTVAHPDHGGRLVFLADPARSRAAYRQDTDDRNLLALAGVSPAVNALPFADWRPPAGGFVTLGDGWPVTALRASHNPPAIVTE